MFDNVRRIFLSTLQDLSQNCERRLLVSECFSVFLYVRPSHSVLLRMRYITEKRVEKIKTHFMFNTFFFNRKLCNRVNNVEKYCGVRQATNDNVQHALYMLDT